MFIRKQGRQCLLLASFRDAQGRVRQRRLGAFRDRESLDRQWQHLSQTVPPREQKRLRELRPKAEALLEQLPPDPTPLPDKIRRATCHLLNLLSQQPQTELSPELQTLRTRLQEPAQGDLPQRAEFQRSLLNPRRRSYWAHDAAVQPYVRSLEHVAQELQKQGDLRQSLAVQQQRMALTHGDRAPLESAALLHGLGRLQEAHDLLTRVPLGDGWRDYHLATLCWQMQRQPEAMQHLFRALTLDPEVASDSDHAYWTAYKGLWDEPSRRVLRDLASLPVIRFPRARARQIGRTPRKLVPPVAHGWLLDRALKVASGMDPGKTRGRLDSELPPVH